MTDVTDVTNDGTAPISTVTPNPDKLEGDYDARAVKLLRVRRRVGQGTVDDPVRIAISLWTEGGELIHEIDPARALTEREELLAAALEEALNEWGQALASQQPEVIKLAQQKRIARLRSLLQ